MLAGRRFLDLSRKIQDSRLGSKSKLSEENSDKDSLASSKNSKLIVTAKIIRVKLAVHAMLLAR